MVLVGLRAVLLERRAISLRLVAVAAAVILLAAPESLMSASFQMSFGAVTALIAGYEAWERHRTRPGARPVARSEEHTSELQSLMRISYAVFCLKKKNEYTTKQTKKRNNKHTTDNTNNRQYITHNDNDVIVNRNYHIRIKV